MKIKERYKVVFEYLEQLFPNAETELQYANPFELLVAVILSAQCTDKRVNIITPPLFQKFPGPQEMAMAEISSIFEAIRSVTYPNSKAKYLKGMAEIIQTVHGGIVPLDVKELIKLPGVGRKTANVITSVLDKQPNMAVDTHVFRVSARLGLTQKASTVLKTENQLTQNIEKDKIHAAHHLLILFGRYHCTARKPNCSVCGLIEVCKFHKSLASKVK